MRKRYPDIVSELLSDLRSGRFRVGDPLPSEAEFCERFGTSRSTIRSAMSELGRLGLIERRQGAATRILSTEPPPTYVHSMTATGDLMQFAGPSRRRVREMVPVIADEDLAKRLDGRPGRRWLLIRQTRHVDGQQTPVGWTDVYLGEEHAGIGPEIPDYPGLIYALLEERRGIVITEIRQSIRAVPMPPDLANVLGADPGGGALELRRQYRDRDGVSQIVSLSVLPAETYAYEITLHRQALPTGNRAP